VVTPTYNRPEYLEETILSVLNQNYPNLEYIIVDGGSTDRRVFEIIRKYENQLAWWISEPDGGHAEAIKKGFDRSTGEILAWLCSDDSHTPGALLAVGKVFKLLPDADVVYGNANMVDAEGRFLRELRSVPYSRLALPVSVNIHQTSIFWRRSLYERVGGMNLEYNRYASDHELFYRFANAGARFVFLRKTLANYRVHPTQTGSAERDKVYEYAWKAMQREFPFWSQRAIYPIWRSVMRIRQFCWHIRQGEIDYLLRQLWSKVRFDKHLQRSDDV
jgi:glycosyltransferase involved in cell wall biosynthesis